MVWDLWKGEYKSLSLVSVLLPGSLGEMNAKKPVKRKPIQPPHIGTGKMPYIFVLALRYILKAHLNSLNVSDNAVVLHI